MSNPRLELYHVKQFLDQYLGTNYQLTREPEPEPDFSIKTDGRFIGIEHTELIRQKDSSGVNIMGHYKASEKIMQEAERIFNQNHNDCLRVSVSFKCSYGLAAPVCQLYNNDIKPLGAFIANFVTDRLNHILQAGHGSSFSFESFDWDTGKIIFPDKIDHIRICNTVDYENSCWVTSEGIVVPDLYTSIEFQSTLSKKNFKPANYCKPYDSVWLLMVEDSMNLTSYFDFYDYEKPSIESAFDKVFVLRRSNNAIVEIPVV